MSDDKAIDDAWKEMGNTNAGRLARKKLVEVLMRVPIARSELGALHVDLGIRTLARELLTLLDAEYTPNGRDADPDANLRSDRKPVDVSGPARGARRRVPIEPPSRI